ncbi:MAG: hypothetical protein ACK4GD_00040 [Sphingomonadaceae bacterium]
MILNRIFVALSLALVLQLAVPMASAQEQNAIALSGDVKVVRVIEENGVQRTVLEEPRQVIPGDRVVFTTSYRNTSSEAVEEFVVTNPVPAAVMLAETGDFVVSVDGGKSFGSFQSAVVNLEDGADRPAELADVTHVRWTLARLEPGTSGSLTYFAVIR